MIVFFANIADLLGKHAPRKAYALFSVAILLGGCALSQSIEQQITGNSETEMSAEQLTAELNAIKESHKKLERLSELESDLMTILNELANQSQIQQGPEEFRSETIVEKVEPEPPPEPATKIVIKPKSKPKKKQSVATAGPQELRATEQIAQQPDNSSIQAPMQQTMQKPMKQSRQEPETALPLPVFRPLDHVLWLGFYISEDAAIAGMQRLQSRLNYQSQRLRVQLVSNANQRGQYFGLMMGPFQNTQHAGAYCSALTRYGQYCQVRQIPAR